MHLVDFDELRLRRPPRSFQILLKLRVVHHLLKVFFRLPHVDYHDAVVGSRTGLIALCSDIDPRRLVVGLWMLI